MKYYHGSLSPMGFKKWRFISEKNNIASIKSSSLSGYCRDGFIKHHSALFFTTDREYALKSSKDNKAIFASFKYSKDETSLKRLDLINIDRNIADKYREYLLTNANKWLPESIDIRGICPHIENADDWIKAWDYGTAFKIGADPKYLVGQYIGKLLNDCKSGDKNAHLEILHYQRLLIEILVIAARNMGYQVLECRERNTTDVKENGNIVKVRPAASDILVILDKRIIKKEVVWEKL